MNKKSACLVLNGEINEYDTIKKLINKNSYDVIIAVDGGANHLDKMDIIPDYLVGDLDSILPDVKKKLDNIDIDVKKLPRKKDLTDTQNAIELSKSIGISKVDLFAATGGRIDHELANILLLDYINKSGLKASIITEYEEITILENENMILNGNKGDIVSILPIKGDAIGIILKDFEYNLDDFTMKFSESRGISNVMLKNNCYISVKNGCILIFRNREV